MIKNVLVAVDFSPLSTLAVHHGLAAARKFRAKLSLLHIVESPTAMLYAFPVGAENVEAQRVEQAERLLAALVSPEDREDLDVRFLLKTGDISERIGEAVREQGADLVVMGTHGRGLFGRLLIGSVTHSLLRELVVPVLTVCHVMRPLEFRRILFATDLSDVADQAFRFSLDLAATTGATLVVAHVLDTRSGAIYEPPQVTAVFEEDRQAEAQQARAKFSEFEAEGLRRNVKIETVLAEGNPSQTILRIADENTADIIILQVRKRGRIDLAVLGSTAEPVIREAHVPVLSVPVGA